MSVATFSVVRTATPSLITTSVFVGEAFNAVTEYALVNLDAAVEAMLAFVQFEANNEVRITNFFASANTSVWHQMKNVVAEDVSTIAAGAVVGGISLFVGAFGLSLVVDTPATSLAMAIGMLLAAAGFGMVEHAARRRSMRAA